MRISDGDITIYHQKIGDTITTELGRALTVIKEPFKSMGTANLPPKTVRAIKIKSGMIDYVGEGNPHVNLVTVELMRLLPIWVTVKYKLLAFCQ